MSVSRFSGTLSERELRKALAGIKPKIDKSLHPMFAGLMSVLDGDGSGEIDMEEWKALLPAALRDDIRLKGEALLSVQSGAKALGSKSGLGKIVDGRERHKEMAVYKENLRRAREASHLYDASHHLSAAKKGETAYEIDLFHLFDTDGSGTLSRRELRRAMAGIKPKIDKSLHHLFALIMDTLDEDGNG